MYLRKITYWQLGETLDSLLYDATFDGEDIFDPWDITTWRFPSIDAMVDGEAGSWCLLHLDGDRHEFDGLLDAMRYLLGRLTKRRVPKEMNSFIRERLEENQKAASERLDILSLAEAEVHEAAKPVL